LLLLIQADGKENPELTERRKGGDLNGSRTFQERTGTTSKKGGTFFEKEKRESAAPPLCLQKPPSPLFSERKTSPACLGARKKNFRRGFKQRKGVGEHGLRKKRDGLRFLEGNETKKTLKKAGRRSVPTEKKKRGIDTHPLKKSRNSRRERTPYHRKEEGRTPTTGGRSN